MPPLGIAKDFIAFHCKNSLFCRSRRTALIISSMLGHNGSSGEITAFMRILVFGFTKYGPFDRNITEEIVKDLKRSRSISTKIFGIRFSKSMFEEALRTSKPDYVIGLGQHPRARKLRIEKIARNLRRTAPHLPQRRIQRGREKIRRVSLQLPASGLTTITYRAGTYLCNYSMWVVEGWCRLHGAKFAFLHVPRRANRKEILAYLRSLIADLKRTRH